MGGSDNGGSTSTSNADSGGSAPVSYLDNGEAVYTPSGGVPNFTADGCAYCNANPVTQFFVRLNSFLVDSGTAQVLNTTGDDMMTIGGAMSGAQAVDGLLATLAGDGLLTTSAGAGISASSAQYPVFDGFVSLKLRCFNLHSMLYKEQDMIRAR